MAKGILFKRPTSFDSRNKQSLLEWAKWLKGKTLLDSLSNLPEAHKTIALREIQKLGGIKILPDGQFKGGKGNLGLIVEIIHFGLAGDNEAKADLFDAGLELKVTGIIHNSKGIRAKERLSLGMIDYESCMKSNLSFEEDKEVVKSLKGMLLMTYKYSVKDAEPLHLVFGDSFIWEPIKEERDVIIKDWGLIQAMVRSGYAHMLSERYAHALGAPPKGAGKDSDFVIQPRPQPYTYSQTVDEMLELGVEESIAREVAKDFSIRVKVPGDSRKGYTLPKDLSLLKRLGKYPARRRCYSLTNSYLTKVIRSKTNGS
jgi:DNA mismatch repair protein MutH